MNVVLDAHGPALFDERPQLALLVQRIQKRVAASDAAVDEALADLDHVRVALSARRLILDAIESVADPIAFAEVVIIDPISSQGERPTPPIVAPDDVVARLRDLHGPVVQFLAPATSISGDVRRLQDRLQQQRDQITRRRAAIHDRLSGVYDALRKTLALLQRLIVDHKLDRQRCVDDALVDVLGQRAVAFGLKLGAMRRRLELDVYRPGAVRALRCIRDRLRADLDRARGELDAARRRLGQYAGIVEFDAIVAEYGAVRRQIALQRQLLRQLNVTGAPGD